MALVKTVKAAGRRVGGVLDAEDRVVLGTGLVWFAGGSVVVVGGAAVVAVAVRLFDVISGV